MNIILFFLILYLQNNDFEEWQGEIPLYWVVEHPQAIPVFKESLNVYSGYYAVKVKRQSPTTSYRTALSQEVTPVTGGFEYNFGIYVFDNDTNVYARVVITWYKDSIYLTYSMTPPSEDLNQWQLLSAIRQAPDTANRAIFKINIYPENQNDTGIIYYDFANFICCGIKEKFEIAVEGKKLRGVILRKGLEKRNILDIFGRKRKDLSTGIYFKENKKIIFIK